MQEAGVRLQQDARPEKSAWRFFPWAVALSLLSVFVVNGAMITTALRGFPGAADDHAFNNGNKYNEIMEQAQRQAALGWHLDVKTAHRGVEVALTGKTGEPLSGGHVEATATHPVGPADATHVAFESNGTTYFSTSSLPAAGQWDLSLIATIGGDTYRATRRVVLP